MNYVLLVIVGEWEEAGNSTIPMPGVGMSPLKIAILLLPWYVGILVLFFKVMIF